MQIYPETIILRHRKERLKKCSLRGLEPRKDMEFFTYPQAKLPPMVGYAYLSLEGEPLSKEDAGRGLFLIDGTWRYAGKMEQWCRETGALEGAVPRALPKGVLTAYPRRQEDCSDPEHGLASVEALYVAYRILGRPLEGLLENYHWQKSFLERNGY
jgi:pre-rRNA-processing protein TSR3